VDTVQGRQSGLTLLLLSFDIVSPIRSPAADAEMLEVVDKVISEFRGSRGGTPSDYEFHVSHESSRSCHRSLTEADAVRQSWRSCSPQSLIEQDHRF